MLKYPPVCQKTNGGSCEFVVHRKSTIANRQSDGGSHHEIVFPAGAKPASHGGSPHEITSTDFSIIAGVSHGVKKRPKMRKNARNDERRENIRRQQTENMTQNEKTKPIRPSLAGNAKPETRNPKQC